MKISEVSKTYDISIDTIRYYERIGLLPTVNRLENGIRDFNSIDIEWIEFIKCMRNAGLPIEVLKDYVTLVQSGDDTKEERKKILVDQRDVILGKMAEMQETVDLLNYKIDVYEKELVKTENNLK
jgi:DNA-binding transcriptional MerR regulator